MIKLDILAFGAHPDDVELGAAGTLIKHIHLGNRVGIVDMTKGQLGTRGSEELRMEEAARAAEVMGLTVRRNLGMEDGFFTDDREHRMALIKVIREFRPEIVLANAISDRHPDHGRASKMVSEACFFSGLRRIETELDGTPQEHWRPAMVYHYIQDRFHEPDFVIDVTEHWAQKMEAIMAFSSQFYDPKSSEPSSPIATPEFLQFLEGRHSTMGRALGVQYAEGFTTERTLGIDSFFDLR